MAILRRFASVAVSVLLFACVVIALFRPLPNIARSPREGYVCVWEDGSTTTESFASAYPDYVSSSELLHFLYRGGMYGTIASTAQYAVVRKILGTGGLAELLSLEMKGLRRLERLSVYRGTNECVWYSNGYFVWGKHGLTEAESAYGNTLILLSGSISSSRLKLTGAKRLELRAEAELSAKTLVGTAVESITAHAPYAEAGGAVYLDTGTARRLIAAAPVLSSLTVSGCDYADEGALLACSSLEELILPFAGNAPSSSGTDFHGELGYLFSDGKDYFVPSSLRRVKITGGTLTEHAFYRCRMIEEIHLCGMECGAIHRDALADCTGWKTVHSPDPEINLYGTYTSYAAPCGCTVFERTGSFLR